MAALTLRVFISSPGDVGQERVQATRVLKRLQGEFGGVVALEPILWESEPLRATAHFQEQLIRPAEADIVICVLWSRLGTQLPGKFQRPDGTLYASGTEWEFEDAAQSFQERGVPDLLVYRKMSEVLASISDEKAIFQRLEQKRALDAFLDRWFGSADSAFKAAFHTFKTLDEFEGVLETHLRKLIRDRLPRHFVEEGEARMPVLWHKGSPYRGLEPFDVEHAPTFFGRARALGEIRQALLRQAAGERAFLLILGMSGCGKTSLVRAGLLPNLSEPGVIEGIGLWRWCVFRPSDAAGDLCEGLVLALLGARALPELEAGGMSAQELAALFREAPQRAVAPIRMGLKAAADAVARQEGLSRPPEARLAVLVDPLEEMFTLARVDASQRERFIAVLSALARSGLVWVIATMRSDFYPRCPEIPELVALKEGDGQYDLVPPTFAEIAQMIGYPARAAGLRFEKDPQSGERLDSVLHEAAARDPEALPLLEFTLDELFKHRTPEGVLTFAAYERLGGLEGALTQRAEEVLTSLDASVQAALPTLLRALVTVGQGEGSPVSGRRVSLASLASTPGSTALLEALVQARLLVTDRADDGQAVVGVAHEALLRHWLRVQRWLEDDREFLRTRDRTAAAATRWLEEGKRPDLLLPAGKLLAEAEHIMVHRRPELAAGLVEYVEASRNYAARSRRRRAQGQAAITAAVLVFGVFSSVQWQKLEQQKEQTVAAIANLTDVPQYLHGVDDRASARILHDIFEANNKTLEKAQDIPATRRAKAVNGQIHAEELVHQHDYEGALRVFQPVLDLENELGKDKRSTLDQRNLGVFYVTQGEILEGLSRYDEALKAYQQSRTYTQLARDLGDSGAGRVLWYNEMISADLLRRLHRLDEAAKAAAEGLPLVQAGATGRQPSGAREDLAYNYKMLGDILQAQGDDAQLIGDAARTKGYWRGALDNYLKSERSLRVLTPDQMDSQTQGVESEIARAIASLRRKQGGGEVESG